jgi:hypothetical protein
MPIELLLPRMRKNIAWLGQRPPADGEKAFVEREYIVSECTDSDLQKPEYLVGLSGVVFTQSTEKPLRITNELMAHANRLLDYDCRVIVRAAKGVGAIVGALRFQGIPVAGLPADAATTELEDPPLPFARYFDGSVGWGVIANFLQTCPHRPYPNLSLKFEGAQAADRFLIFDSSIEVLLRRAFWDCSKLSVEKLPGARSGAKVYRVHAELGDGVLGEVTQPFIIKTAPRDEIVSEYGNYEAKVHPYIPFHLGPHLDYKRCCLGAKDGLLVLNYVTESETLLRCAGEGRSLAAIACLFDRTLFGWHRQAREVLVPFAEPLTERFPTNIDAERAALARTFGATLGAEELKGLFSRCISTPVLVGPVHGDLHATNVRVRGSDAVIIDFRTQDNFPLLFDAATLEVSLLVEGDFRQDIQPREWFDAVKPLYEGRLFACLAPQPAPSSWSSWFYASVRQIRGYARQWECGNGQYAAALSLALMQKAEKDSNATEPEATRRAGAYVFAELTLRHAFSAVVV